MPSPSAPSSPASRSTARSTDTVVCGVARSTMGCPADPGQFTGLRDHARGPAGASIPPASTSSLSLPRVSRASNRRTDPGLGPDQVQREFRMPRHIPVADQHGHVGGHPLGTQRGRAERGGHREEDHRAARRGGQHRAALAAGHVHAHHGHGGRAARRPHGVGQRRPGPGRRRSPPGRPARPARTAAASASVGTTPMTVPAPARPGGRRGQRAALAARAEDSHHRGARRPVGPASPGPAPPRTTRSVRAGAPHTSRTARARAAGRSAGSTAAMDRPNRIACPAHGTCSDWPSQRSSPSVMASGVRLSETSVAIRSPAARPERRRRARLVHHAGEHPAGPGHRVLHLAPARR